MSGNPKKRPVRPMSVNQASSPSSTGSLRVIVVELDDVVPRRQPELPNLYVGVTSENPAVRARRL